MLNEKALKAADDYVAEAGRDNWSVKRIIEIYLENANKQSVCKHEVMGEGIDTSSVEPVSFKECMKCDYTTQNTGDKFCEKCGVSNMDVTNHKCANYANLAAGQCTKTPLPQCRVTQDELDAGDRLMGIPTERR